MGNPVHLGGVLEHPSLRGFMLAGRDLAVDQAGIS
jgi:hypothetical protein